MSRDGGGGGAVRKPGTQIVDPFLGLPISARGDSERWVRNVWISCCMYIEYEGYGRHGLYRNVLPPVLCGANHD